jgi:hypothetical protein
MMLKTLTAIFALSTCVVLAAEPSYTIIHHPNPDAPMNAFFGHSVAILDWNADGVPDVAAGAPGENRAYLFYGPEFKEYEVFGVGMSGDFGHSMAAGNLDGLPGDELIISAPKADVGETERAGAVWVFTRGQKEARKLVSREPRLDGVFGNAVAVGDFDGNGLLDVAVGSPGQTGGPSTGTASVFLNAKVPDRFLEVILRNHQKTGAANFGHDLAVCDWNGDGIDDLCVGAIWNTNSEGIEGAGQLILYLGPIGKDGRAAERLVFEDNLSTPADRIVRWGMSIDARDQTILVGSPRKDVPPVADAGMGFVFRPNEAVRNFSPRPVENGILGYRARIVDFVGNEVPDIAFLSLPVGIYVWDGDQPDGKPTLFERPPGGSSHWCAGIAAGQIYPGGKEELLLGDPRWSPPDRPANWNSGRLLIFANPPPVEGDR